MKGIERILREFKEPPKEFSPVPIWWWSGERVLPERLRWQMERFAEGGIYNLLIIGLAPISPLFGADADDPPYYSDEWWELIDGACKNAHELGIRLWLYDQIGFSGASHQAFIVKENPAFAGEILDSRSVEGSGPLKVEAPLGTKPQAAFAIPIDENGKTEGRPVQVKFDGMRAEFDCSSPHRLRIIYSVRSGFDYFSPEACAALLARIHGKIEEKLGHWFGKVIVGTFQDELPTMPSWSRCFAEEFKRRKGYDLIPRLVWLWEGESPEAKRCRLDYYDVRAELAEESFFKPFFAWHEKHGMICGFDQMEPARNGDPLASTTYYADYTRTHRWYGAPGSDHWGDAKIHSSISHVYGRPRTWIESFHSTGWGGTLEETYDWLLPWFQGGANLYNPHAVYYSTKGAWWEWAPPSTCWRQPYWRHYPLFSKSVSRLSYILSQGVHVCDTGVIYPSTSIKADLTLSGPYFEPELYERAKRSSELYNAVTGKISFIDPKPGILNKLSRDFEVLGEDALEQAEVTEQGLWVGNECYRVMILPGCGVIREETAEKLFRFVKAGGTLVAVGEKPQGLGDEPKDSWTARLAGLFDRGEATFVCSLEELSSVLSKLDREIETEFPALHRRIGTYNLLYIPAAFPNATRITRREWFLRHYSFSTERYGRETEVVFRGLAEREPRFYLLDPMTGECKPVSSHKDGGDLRVRVLFDSGPAAILLWTENGVLDLSLVSRRSAADTLERTESIDLSGGWESEIIPTLDNRFGDFDYPGYPGSPPVSTWQFEHRVDLMDARMEGVKAEDRKHAGSGFDVAGLEELIEDKKDKVMDEEWSPVHATYGLQAWKYGPSGEDALPMPYGPASGGSILDSVSGWDPVVFSRSRGIYKDGIYKSIYFGPKGHVLEEFLNIEDVKAGEGVHIRTGILMEKDCELHIAVGAFARKRAWVNGAEAESDDTGYLLTAPVHLKKGLNVIDLRFVMEKSGRLRAFWAFTEDIASFRRPEWLITPSPHHRGDPVTFFTDISIDKPVKEAEIYLTAEMPTRIRVNGEEIGSMGGFEPYGEGLHRVHPFAIPNFRQGTNRLEVEITDKGDSTAFVVDGIIRFEDGSEQLFSSGRGWMVKAGGSVVKPAELMRSGGSGFDPAFHCIKRRPHPLPATSWIEEERFDEGVVDPVYDAYFGAGRVEWFRWTLPPGAEYMDIKIHGRAKLWVDSIESDNGKPDYINGRIRLPHPEWPNRKALLAVVPEAGYSGGAVFAAPLTYECGKGCIEPGDWCSQGLSSYSGGVRYSKNVRLEKKAGSSYILDLGAVRGTAELSVNGIPAGARILSPYRFEITELLKDGENRIEITAYNTLAPYFNALSPTPFVLDGQCASGIFGPIRLIQLS